MGTHGFGEDDHAAGTTMTDLQLLAKARETLSDLEYQRARVHDNSWNDPRVADVLVDALRWAYTAGQHDLKQEHKQALDDWVNHEQSNRQKRTVTS